MSLDAVAERYARAIFELGQEANQLTQVTDQIRKLADAYSSSAELRTVLDNPLVSEDKREAVLKAIATRLGMGELSTNSVRLMASRHRLAALPEVARKLGALADDRAGIVRASITSAGPLSEAYYTKLKAALEKSTGKKVVLERIQDPSIIAGVVTRIGDNTIDGSVRGRLRDLERQLVSAAS